MFLDVFIVHFQKDQKHKIDEIIGDQIGISNVVDDAVEDDISQFEHAVSEQFDEKLITLLSDFIEFLSINDHIGEIDVDHPRHGDHESIDH